MKQTIAEQQQAAQDDQPSTPPATEDKSEFSADTPSSANPAFPKPKAGPRWSIPSPAFGNPLEKAVTVVDGLARAAIALPFLWGGGETVNP